MASTSSKVVDIHTHMYPPAYVDILTSRSTIPLIRKFEGAKDPRYIILKDELAGPMRNAGPIRTAADMHR